MYKKLAVYIHIPFCVKKCAYCDFNSAAPHGNEVEDYIEALLNEIRFRSTLAKDHIVNTVFFGGGTPSFIDSVYIVRILDILKESFESVRAGSYNPVEVTIECNPGTVDIDKFIAYTNAGINRISLGLQSANEEELRLLGRIHTYNEWLEAVDMARVAGFTNINTDLISGIPGQTVDTFINTLDKVVATGIEHISVYSLIIEKGTGLYDLYGPDILSEEEQDLIDDNDRRIYEATNMLLNDNGYLRYEISNYSKPGYECIHNKVYWTRGDYIGLGLGAASLIDNMRFSNSSKFADYIGEYSMINKCNSSYMSGFEKDIESLNKNEQMSEFMILGLRMNDGISEEEFRICFDTDIYDVYGEVINSWVLKGGLITEDGRVKCTRYGFDICNQIFLDFI